MVTSARVSFLGSVVVIAAIVTGCGGDDDGGPVSTPIPAADFCMEWLTAACDAEQRCCDDPSMRSESAGACLTASLTACQSFFGAIVGDARTGYNPAQAGVFLARGKAYASSCDPAVRAWAGTDSGFASIFDGTVALGGDCTPSSLLDPVELIVAAVECADPNACAVRATPALTGTCQARVGAGAVCATNIECTDGLRCNGGSCGAKVADGSPCTGDGDCQSNKCTVGVCEVNTVNSVYCAPGT